MIINPLTELETLLVSGTAKATDELRGLLDERQIVFEVKGDQILLDRSLEILKEDSIRAEMSDILHVAASLRFEIHRDIDSTNDQVLKHLKPEELYVCLAERQTAGKGRRGRSWISPFGHNLYLTIGRYLKGPMSALEGLSLVVGMQAVDVLRELGLTEVGLKWPNDLILEQGKLGGILVELKSQDQQGVGVVIGTGINLMLSSRDAGQIDQNWSAVGSSTVMSRNKLAGRLASRLVRALDDFSSSGFGKFMERWPDYNLYAGQTVKVVRGEEEFIGVDRGVDENGNLLLETDSGLQVHGAGEVSLRSLPTS